MRGKGGGKRWMKCRGNEEIKIGTTEQVSEKEKTLHLFKSTWSFLQTRQFSHALELFPPVSRVKNLLQEFFFFFLNLCL